MKQQLSEMTVKWNRSQGNWQSSEWGLSEKQQSKKKPSSEMIFRWNTTQGKWESSEITVKDNNSQVKCHSSEITVRWTNSQLQWKSSEIALKWTEELWSEVQCTEWGNFKVKYSALHTRTVKWGAVPCKRKLYIAVQGPECETCAVNYSALDRRIV